MQEAAARLRGVIRETPLECSAALSQAAGAEVHLKLEGMQRTGSFKLRGAYNCVASLSPAEQARGVVTASAGNHGQGVALAARLLGCRARVYLPEAAPEVKQRRIARLGAELVRVAGGYDQAHAAAERWAEEHGVCFVHAFSDPRVVAGQGTLGLELFEQLPTLRTIVLPVGGGGLAGGVGVVARALGPTVRVVGVQTVETAAMHASLAAGELVSPPYGETLCEGLSGDTDARALGLAQAVLDQVVLVEEAAVRDAIRWLYVEEGVVAEGSAAVVVAALLHGAAGPLYGPVAGVLSGSNLDAQRLASILAEG